MTTNRSGMTMRMGAAMAAAAMALAPAVAAEGPVRTEKTFVATSDGSRQKYVELAPEPFEPGAGALIALHGHGSDRLQFVDDPRGECRAAREAALERGLLYVSPDYRGKTSWMGPAAEADVLDLLETLRRERGVDKFYFCGGSMGGTSALTFAVRHPASENRKAPCKARCFLFRISLDRFHCRE